ncbi:hypothetical protein CASFOL_006952 [Castilleja foliolosa]|uniref:Protein kinase domain-containing protein n=1 Tax=Castilleja foliolosa TaxID=1961234 RepID=A0ABD3E8S0_9LAMI
MSNRTLFFPSPTILILLLWCTTICIAQNNNSSLCTPSSCGDITITYPFRLKTDPSSCGHPDSIFALECLQNRTTLRSKSRIYVVQTITYDNFTLRLSDPGLVTKNYSSCPTYYSSPENDLYSSYMNYGTTYGPTVTFLNCVGPVNNPSYVLSPFCGRNTSAIFFNSYVTVKRILVSDLEEVCAYDTSVGTAWPDDDGGGNKKYSYSEIHDMMAYGFEMSWYRVYCGDCGGDCVLVEKGKKVRCRYSCYEIVSLRPDSFACKLVFYGLYAIYGGMAIGGLIALRLVLGIPFLIGLIVYKWKTRHSSMQQSQTIQEISQHQVNFMPINYNYGEIKKMTKNLNSKLGLNNNLFKGNLRSGPSVAIEMLINSSSTDKEFISHVSKLSKISHPNVVKLVGFCIEGSKRALVHELVNRGSSLEKHVSLKYVDIYKIAIGMARGVECLHGAGIYDIGINPQNVLIDEEFNPKISGCGRNDRKMGFIAPEVFYKNIGEISCIADVYSYGMVVMEMAGRVEYSNKSDEIYFPFWVYKELMRGKKLEIMGADEEEVIMVKKVIIVGLWCIQIRGVDRPLMSEVVEMLEGGFERLDLPQMLFQRESYG